jgi:hypothetical protein
MGKFLKIVSVFSLVLLFASTVSADFEKSKWIYSKEIRLVQFASKRVASFSLDNDVFDNSKGLSDLRIINSAGVETPYKLVVDSTASSRQTFGVKITDLGSRVGEYTQMILDLGRSGEAHNNLTFSTTSVNFRRQVEVEASADLINWLVIKKANEGGYIYDYSVDFKAQNTTVNYPDSTNRYLRVKIIDNGEVPLKITGASVYRYVPQGSREVFYVPKVEKGEDKGKTSSFYVLDLEAKGIPSSKLSFFSKNENYNRQVALEGSNDKQNWYKLTSEDVIFNYNTPKFVGAKSTLSYPESNYRYLKLTVFNRDDRPINIDGFRVSGVLRKVLFEAEPGTNYKLYYGNNKARFAEYDLGAFIQYLDTTNTVVGVLGAQEKNSEFKGEIAPEVPLTERYPYLLAGVLGIMVLILGTVVVRMAFAVKKGR